MTVLWELIQDRLAHYILKVISTGFRACWELTLFHCAACAQQAHVGALTVLVSVLLGAKMGYCSES